MTFSLQGAGGVESAVASIAQQAEHYADPVVKHVSDFISKVTTQFDMPHGISISASGHGHDGGMSLNLGISALGPSEAAAGESPAAQSAAPPPTAQ